MSALPDIPIGALGADDWVRRHLDHLASDSASPSSIRGGQSVADAALARLDITGYAARRNNVSPTGSRGATQLSPYIRNGLLTLPQVWDAVADAPARDRTKFRDELLWQEYSRHLYARLGHGLRSPLRYEATTSSRWAEAWPREMACMTAVLSELETDGWLVNQTRMWLASQYVVRAGWDWQRGERQMFRHLLDGSPANLLGWQWTIGAATGKAYGFSRWQVEKRAPALCRSCALASNCPIQNWPAAETNRALTAPDLRARPTDAGPTEAIQDGDADAVWLTAESLGDNDVARVAHPGLPRIFVFDELLLRRLHLSRKRLVFLAECVAETGAQVRLGNPATELAGLRLATTWNYTPGWKRLRPQLDLAAIYPWPWLRRPSTASLRSYSAWVRRPRG